MEKSIGDLIKEELEKQERSISWFARKLSCDRSNVYRLFQKESIDTTLLFRVSLLLKRDFFSYLSERLKEKMQSQDSQENRVIPASLYCTGNYDFLVFLKKY